MIIVCKKCDNRITKDLYQSYSWEKYYEPVIADLSTNSIVIGEEDYEPSLEYRVRKGTFMFYKHSNKHYKLNKYIAPLDYIINPDDVLCHEQFLFETGNGCCGNSWVEFYCPCCKYKIGEQNLDCWQSKHVRFFASSVERSFKK